MTITTITRTSADPIPAGADFNAVLDTGNPCAELAALKQDLQNAYDSVPDIEPGQRVPVGPMGIINRKIKAIQAEIDAKEAECDAYNGTPTPTPTPAPVRTETKPQAQEPSEPKIPPRILIKCPDCY
jgi:hypothetical protein